jgi:CheY-like chemotaxis protein
MSTRKKIILVEDNLDDVRLTKLAFENLDIPAKFVHCANGEELLAFLKEEPLSNINYILLDLNMPKLNGFDVLNNFQQDENLKKLPVIVFTTSSNPADIQKCYDTGANAYVVKPFDFTDLEKSISAISNFWGDVNVKPMFT